MTIIQTRDLIFTILNSNGESVEILIGLYATVGGFTAWSLRMSVPTETGGWKKIIGWPITGGQFSSYDRDQVKQFLASFANAVNGALSRIYGDEFTVDIPDDDPTTESREELWVRLLGELLTIEENRLVVKSD